MNAVHPIEPPFDPYEDTTPQGDVPPQDMAAEQAVLGSMLVSRKVDPDTKAVTYPAIQTVTALLTENDYYRPAHSTIHQAIATMHSAGDPIDAVTVANHIGPKALAKVGGAVYLHTLVANLPTVANAEYYAEIVRDQAKLRACIASGHRLIQLGRNGDIKNIHPTFDQIYETLDNTFGKMGPANTQAITGLRDLSWILTGTPPEVPPPTYCVRTDGHALFYAGKVNGVFGDPETAKTWLAQTAIIEALAAGGTAAMIDVDHNGPDHTAARLLLLGARLEHLADPEIFRYYEPEEADELHAAIHDIATRRPDVVVVDSLGEIFPILGVNTNDGDEMTTAMRQTVTRIANTGSTVITIDHLPKSVDARATGFAIGSIAKKRMIRGAYIKAEERIKPAPGQKGHISLRIEKDTSGELRKTSPGGYAGTFTLDSTQPHITTWQIHRDETPKNEDGTFRPTAIMEAISRHIEDNDQCTFRDINTHVTAKEKHVRLAIELLINEGFVSKINGPRNSQLHHSISHYRQAEDDHINPSLDI